MKYTRSEANEIVEVHSCQKCPHMEKRGLFGLTEAMYCIKPSIGKIKTAGKKLIGRWEGPYHATCPLPSNPNNVPELEKTK